MILMIMLITSARLPKNSPVLQISQRWCRVFRTYYVENVRLAKRMNISRDGKIL